MKSKNKKSLTINIWIFLTLFSIAILLLLWGFQILFTRTYYERTKINEAVEAGKDIQNYYNNYYNNFEENVYKLSYSTSICIEITDKNNNTLYTTDNFNRGCINQKFNPDLNNIKIDFINGDKDNIKIKLINKPLNNKTLIYGIKLDNNLYAFLNTSLDPIELTIVILQKHFITTTIIVLIIAFIVGYFVSKKLVYPITRLNESAKKLKDNDTSVNLDDISDIKEIDELAHSLNEARCELIKTEELRRDLMANVSHDLKTPLTMIKAYAELVKDISYKNDKDRNEHLGIIIEEVDRLNLLVEDILTLSSIQADTNSKVYEDFDLILLIRNIIKRYGIYSITEAYTFEFNHFLDSIIIHSDKKRIEQVIYNLISNAINYTGDDKKVIVNVINLKSSIKVEIKDTGKGIKDVDIDKIWDKYYKSEKKHKRHFIGTGLGLSIVKNILIQCGYNYGVTSSKNGSVFYFEIPKKDLVK